MDYHLLAGNDIVSACTLKQLNFILFIFFFFCLLQWNIYLGAASTAESCHHLLEFLKVKMAALTWTFTLLRGKKNKKEKKEKEEYCDFSVLIVTCCCISHLNFTFSQSPVS